MNMKLHLDIKEDKQWHNMTITIERNGKRSQAKKRVMTEAELSDALDEVMEVAIREIVK